MRIKIALLAAVVAALSLALVPSAPAASSSIKVTTKLAAAVDFCRPSPEQLGYSLYFTASIKRKNTSLPKSVRVTFKVKDAATGSQYGSGVVTLTKKNKFKNTSKRFVVPLGAAIYYDLISSYRAPNTGKKVTAKAKIPDQVPTAAEIDPLNPPIPPCV